jgi:phosphatidylglycerophosphate synthase
VITARHKPAIDRLLGPLARRLAASHISPMALTLLGPLLTSLACWWLVSTRAIVPFCLTMGVIGVLDGLDGAVARLSGRVTKVGAYLDALADRYVDALVVLTAAWVSGYWGLSLIVVVGALLVSYAKARAAMEVPISNLEWPDLMERMERSTFFLVGLLASALVSWRPLGRDLFWWTLLALAILTHLTVAQRAARAVRLIRIGGVPNSTG